MKNFFLLSLVLFSFVLFNTSCKKKKDAVVPVNTTPAGPSASITFGTSPKTTFTPSAIDMTGAYDQSNSNMLATIDLAVDFTTVGGTGSAKPTANATINLATTSTVFVYYYDANGDSWTATAGNLSVTVEQGYVTSSFTNLTFHNTTTVMNDIFTNSGSIRTN